MSSAGPVVIKLLQERKKGGSKRIKKQIHQYWIEGGRVEIEEKHLPCQVRNILKTKKFLKVEIEALRRKVTTPQEPVKALIENVTVDGSDVPPVIKIRVEQNHPAENKKNEAGK